MNRIIVGVVAVAVGIAIGIGVTTSARQNVPTGMNREWACAMAFSHVNDVNVLMDKSGDLGRAEWHRDLVSDRQIQQMIVRGIAHQIALAEMYATTGQGCNFHWN